MSKCDKINCGCYYKGEDDDFSCNHFEGLIAPCEYEDDYEEEDIEKFRKAIAKELGITLPKAKKETKAKGKKGKK